MKRSAEDGARSLLMEKLVRADDLDGQIALGRTLDWANPHAVLDLYSLAIATYRRFGQAEFYSAAFHLLQLLTKPAADTATGLPPSRLVYMILQLIHLIELRSYGGRIPLTGANYAFLHAAARQALRLAEQSDEATALREPATRLLERFFAVAVAGQGAPTVHYLRPRSPGRLQIEPTNACNLKCTMCPRTLAMTRPVAHMPVELYERALDGWSGRRHERTFRHAAYDASWTITMHGQVKLFYLGEIFEHPQFDEIIRTTTHSGATPLVQTNGVHLVKRSVRRRLLNAAPPALGISLDGISEETYNTIRNGSKWQGIVQALRALHDERRAAGLEAHLKLHVTTILPNDDPEIRAKVGEFLKPVVECVDEVMFVQLGRAHNPEFYDGGGAVRSMALAQQPLWPEVLAGIPEDAASCTEPLSKLNVLSDGTVTPCCPDVNADLKLGTIADGIDTVWNAEATRQLQMAHLSHALEEYALCRSCITAGHSTDL